MPSCMENLTKIVVLSPGFMVVEPTTGRKGQQPSRVFTVGVPSMMSGWAPRFFNWKVCIKGFPNGTSPKSIKSTSTNNLGQGASSSALPVLVLEVSSVCFSEKAGPAMTGSITTAKMNKPKTISLPFLIESLCNLCFLDFPNFLLLSLFL